jgi:hypothetical protein
MKIKLIIEKQPENYDHDLVRFDVDDEVKGLGFIPRKPDDQTIALERCPICGRENYAMNVSSGQCTWCEFNTNQVEK